MPGFEALYKQTVTVFNRKTIDGKEYWCPYVIPNVHLITDKSIIISTYGEQSADNVRLHIRYKNAWNGAVIPDGSGMQLAFLEPKEFAKSGVFGENITFACGDNFDFFMAGEYSDLDLIDDTTYRNGFYNYMNRNYDNVFVITTCSKFNLIPHFEIGGR